MGSMTPADRDAWKARMEERGPEWVQDQIDEKTLGQDDSQKVRMAKTFIAREKAEQVEAYQQSAVDSAALQAGAAQEANRPKWWVVVPAIVAVLMLALTLINWWFTRPS